MKSSRFCEIWQISWNPPKNLINQITQQKLFSFMECSGKAMSLDCTWNPPDFTWNLPDFMKSAEFHEYELLGDHQVYVYLSKDQSQFHMTRKIRDWLFGRFSWSSAKFFYFVWLFINSTSHMLEKNWHQVKSVKSDTYCKTSNFTSTFADV